MCVYYWYFFFFFFQAEDGIRDHCVTGVQTCALPICPTSGPAPAIAAKWWPNSTHLFVGTKSWPLLKRSAGVARSESSRSEERRVGKECRSRGWPDHEKKKKTKEYE